MCGIVGILDFRGRPIERELFDKMCESLIHRGPDDMGAYFEERETYSLALGHRRLSIIDLKGGHQPMTNEDNTVYIVYNGEIYNFLPLRAMLKERGHIFKTNSDSEVILHLYEEEHDDFLKYLEGMFALAIWDSRLRKLTLARDRAGKKPLLYSQVGRVFLFASEFDALLLHPSLSKEVDFEAIHYYLTYLCVPAPLTAFKGIKKLPPGHKLSVSLSDIRLERYWNLDYTKKRSFQASDIKLEIKNILSEAVKKRLISDVPLGAFLSGGIDSSVTVALMSRFSSKPVRTFSIGFEDQKFNELRYARMIAQRYNTEHHEFIVKPNALEVLPELVRHYGEPFADSSALPTYYLSKMTRQYVTVALSGDGGDESFAGYRRQLACYLADKFYKAPQICKLSLNLFGKFNKHTERFLRSARLSRGKRYMRWMGIFSDEDKRDLYNEGLYNKIGSIDSSNRLSRLFDEVECLDGMDAALYVDTSFYLPNDLLVKVDIASMANSLEVRCPFLDHKLIELMASLPGNVKVKQFRLKYLLKEIFKEELPSPILRRGKMGFAVPLGMWFRNELNGYIKDTLLSRKALNRGLFNEEHIKTLLRIHQMGKRDYGHHLWTLLMLELWFESFID